MSAKYIFRIDDVTSEMNRDNFYKLENIFDKYNIQPIIGVVPDNQDHKLRGHGKIHDFWGKIKELSDKGRIIAQHGYQHIYCTKNSGIVSLNNYSEFAGLSYKEQEEKLKKGKNILEDKLGIPIKRRMAPAHSFDKNTCKALKYLGFEYITDGLAVYPFTRYGLKRLPQQLWRPTQLPFGTRTICIHLNTINQKQINDIEDFIKRNEKYIGILGNISYKDNFIKKLIDCTFKIMFFLSLNIKYAYTKRSK